MKGDVNDYINTLQTLVGRTILAVDNDVQTDEGVRLTFKDGTALSIGFSVCEGVIIWETMDDNTEVWEP